MHEQGIAQEIIRRAEKYGKVTGIRLVIGELAPASAEEMGIALKMLKPEWKMRIEEEKGSARCGRCKFSGKPKILLRTHGLQLLECPKCGATPEITKGNEIKLKSVSVRIRRPAGVSNRKGSIKRKNGNGKTALRKRKKSHK